MSNQIFNTRSHTHSGRTSVASDSFEILRFERSLPTLTNDCYRL